jgi:hypothetical protein
MMSKMSDWIILREQNKESAILWMTTTPPKFIDEWKEYERVKAEKQQPSTIARFL